MKSLLMNVKKKCGKHENAALKTEPCNSHSGNSFNNLNDRINMRQINNEKPAVYIYVRS